MVISSKAYLFSFREVRIVILCKFIGVEILSIKLFKALYKYSENSILQIIEYR